ncbi:GMC oxidoreductase [Paludisphaera sp.]|uniref:GMC family oxidoreductase n=1 Tax=Paludisphaera sp. TaxID=2017432 RepID=UPI00301D6AC1
MSDLRDDWKDPARTPIDFLVVGAGAGGAPLAARLAERGYTVLVLEMGPGAPAHPPPDSRVDVTEVPLLHPAASEDPRHGLRFFVKHFNHDPEGSRDWKKYPRPEDGPPRGRDEEGIFYPRGQGLGGSTIVNAMITICGPPEDYDEIAEATGDESWRGERMRAYFQRVELCHYARPSLWARIKAFFGKGDGWEEGRHGFRGWLDVTLSDLLFLKRDRVLLRVVLAGVVGGTRSGAERIGELLRAAISGRFFPALDPNHWETLRRSAEGVCRIPVAITPNGRRSSARDRILAVTDARSPHRDRLIARSGFCVTGIILEEGPAGSPGPRAVGVRGLPREHVYEADQRAPLGDPYPEDMEVPLYCRREVLLCGGAFNTPQLLMLSGIGPADHLQQVGVQPRVDLPGVGRNLQDRYEVPIVTTVTDRFRSFDGLGLSPSNPDPHLLRWIENPEESAYRRGIYSTNGGLLGMFVRSQIEDSAADLFIFALAGLFEGYYPGYSDPAALLRRRPDDSNAYSRTITWMILKARTRNREGYVRLRCRNPLRRPEINFRFFPTRPDGERDTDLDALMEGVGVVDQIYRAGRERGAFEERIPPRSLQEEFGGDVREWIKHTAWGHHASGTCRIGADDDPRAVLDSRFRVRGVSGLRVVDASAFPRIPGFFLVSNVFTIAEKAADAISEDHPIPAGELPAEARAELDRVPIIPSRPDLVARRAYPARMERAEAELVAARRRAAGLGERTH